MTHFIGFDLETTGVSSFLDVPVSYGFVERFHEDGTVLTRSDGGYVNPGVAIPPSAAAIHGITDDMVADAPLLTLVTETIVQRLTDAWVAGGVVVGMNVSYDLTMVESLCQRLDLVPLSARSSIGPVLDVLILDRHFDKWRKGARRLTSLCQHYGVRLDAAHSAEDDAAASLDVLDALTLQYPAITHLEPSAINTVLGSWHREWLSSFSSFLEKKGEAPISAGRYEWPLHIDA